jgi:hypothetical protein
MATFNPTKVTVNPGSGNNLEIQDSSRFFRKSNAAPQLQGNEGQTLSQKITKISGSIQNIESIKRLIQALEDDYKKRQEELKYYIDALRSEVESNHETEFTVSVIDTSWQVWQKLSRRFSEQGLCLEVPDACPGQNNNFMYTWSKAEHYLECEIFGHGTIEFFYRNRKNGQVWGEDTTLENRFSTAVLEKAAFFAW